MRGVHKMNTRRKWKPGSGSRLTALRLAERPYQTVKACALKVGVRAETWGKWEADKVVPHQKYREMVAIMFEVSPDHIWKEIK